VYLLTYKRKDISITMLPLLTVVGATGLQGGSVLASALKSKQYRIRAITRNPESPSALKLASQGVEVIAAELDDESSLVKAFEVLTLRPTPLHSVELTLDHRDQQQSSQ
jgi:hypothetical protein